MSATPIGAIVRGDGAVFPRWMAEHVLRGEVPR
jgi:hypothetical protein